MAWFWCGTAVAMQTGTCMNQLWATKLSTQACEIVDYLAQCPSVCDTLEGIAQWRLPIFRLDREIVCVKRGLDELLAIGVVQKTPGNDGLEYYRLNPAKLEDVRAHSQARQAVSQKSSTQ